MAPDASTSPVEWGLEIRVDGKRPEWLAYADKIDVSSHRGDKWYSEGTGGLGVSPGGVFWDNVDRIRLPANHPHYRQPTTPELDPALWDRMVAYIREDVKCWPYGMNAEVGRGILADLPKPVDPDEQYAVDLIAAQGWRDQGPIGEAAVLSMIAKAHRDGRELAGEQA